MTPIEHRGAEGATLTEEGDIAAQRHSGCEGGVQASDRAHDAEAVRADNAHAAACRFLGELFFQIGMAGLLKPRRNDDGSADTGTRTLADEAGNCGRWRDDDG